MSKETAAAISNLAPLQTQEPETAIKDTTANPAPLGLCAFGMTTVLLNIHNAGYYGLCSMILAMGIFYGGIAQVIVGAMEWKKKNTFGTVAFSSYGLFWLTLVAIWTLPKMGLADKTEPAALGAYLAMWGVFTLILFFGTLKASRALQFVFLSLVILFFLLAAVKFTGSVTLEHIAGFEGIVCGASAIYLGAAQILNEVYKKTVLPVG